MRPRLSTPGRSVCTIKIKLSVLSTLCPRTPHPPCHAKSVGKGWITPTPFPTLVLPSAQCPSVWCPLGAGTGAVPRPPSIRASLWPNTLSRMRSLAPTTPAVNTPHLRISVNRSTQVGRGRVPAGNCSNAFYSVRTVCTPLGQPATATRAPCGTNPAPRNRHSSTSRRRARATIPMRRWRLLPPPKRSWNQRLCPLPGW